MQRAAVRPASPAAAPARPARPARAGRRGALRVRATAADDCSCALPGDWGVPDPPSREKRATLNAALAAAVSLPVAGMVGPYAASFVPR